MPTIRELKEKANAKRGDPIYRLMNNLAYYPAKLFLYTPLTPNQITIIWIIGQIISALFLATGDQLTMIISLIFFQAFFIIDCSDGIVARYRKRFSINGIYLDQLGHYLANSILLLTFSIGVFRWYNNAIYLLYGILAVIFFLLNKAITLNPMWYPKEQRNLISDTGKKSLLRFQHKLIYNVFALFRLEHFFNILFWGVVFGYPNYTLILYTLFFFLELVRKIITQYIANEKSVFSQVDDF